MATDKQQSRNIRTKNPSLCIVILYHNEIKYIYIYIYASSPVSTFLAAHISTFNYMFSHLLLDTSAAMFHLAYHVETPLQSSAVSYSTILEKCT